MIRRAMMVAATFALDACGGSKAPAPDTSAGIEPVPAAAAPAIDTARADSTKQASDTSAKASAPTTKPAPGDRDVAIKPKFTIDEKTGKLTPIKKP